MTIIALPALLALVASAAASDPPSLAPIGKWTIGYEEGLCALRHSFGSPGSEVEVSLRPPALGGPIEITLLTSAPATNAPPGRLAATFDDDPPIEEPAQSFAADGSARGVVRWSTNAAILERLSTAKTMAVRVGGNVYRLMLPAAAGALGALRSCREDLLRRWGVDATVLQAERRHVVLDIDQPELRSRENYPRAALKRNAQGKAVAVVSVGSDGKPTGCRIAESSGDADLDKAGCVVATRTRLSPALDSAGRPVASWFVMPVRWQLPS